MSQAKNILLMSLSAQISQHYSIWNYEDGTSNNLFALPMSVTAFSDI
jgi:hypothetical protein